MIIDKYEDTNKRTIVRSWELEFCHAAMYDTGLLQIALTGETRALVQISNTDDLFQDGYLKKFLKCANSVFETAEKSWVYLSVMVLDFSEVVSGEQVRAVLDEDSLSNSSKFAAIVSMLTDCPRLPTDLLLTFAKKQIPAESLESKALWRMKYFLQPNFADKSLTKNLQSGLSKNREVFLQYIAHSSFFAFGSETETFSEFLEKNDTYAKLFKLSEDSNFDYQNVLRVTRNNSNLSLDKAISHMNKTDARQFVTQFGTYEKIFHKFLKDRVQSGVSPASETPKWSSDELKELKNFSKIASLLTMDEMRELLAHMKEDPSSELWNIYHLGDFAPPILAYYFVNKGYHRMSELVRFVQYSADHKDLFMSSTSSYKLKSQKGRRTENRICSRHFIDIADPKYDDIPIEWAFILRSDETRELSEDKSAKDTELFALDGFPNFERTHLENSAS